MCPKEAETKEKVIVGKWGIRLICPCCGEWFDTYIRITMYGGFSTIYHCCPLKVRQFVPEHWYQMFLCLETPDKKKIWYLGSLCGKFIKLDADNEVIEKLESLEGYSV